MKGPPDNLRVCMLAALASVRTARQHVGNGRLREADLRLRDAMIRLRAALEAYHLERQQQFPGVSRG